MKVELSCGHRSRALPRWILRTASALWCGECREQRYFTPRGKVGHQEKGRAGGVSTVSYRAADVDDKRGYPRGSDD